MPPTEVQAAEPPSFFEPQTWWGALGEKELLHGYASTAEKLHQAALLMSRGLRAVGAPASIATPGGGFGLGAEYLKTIAPPAPPPQGLGEKTLAGLMRAPSAIPELATAIRPFAALANPVVQRAIAALPTTLSAVERAAAIQRIARIAQTASGAAGFGAHGGLSAAARGAPLPEVLRETGISTAAGGAFGQLSRLPWYLRPTGAATIGAGQAAAEGGTLKDVVSSAVTLAILDAPAARAHRQASRAATAQQAYQERAEQLLREDQARQDRLRHVAQFAEPEPPRLAAKSPEPLQAGAADQSGRPPDAARDKVEGAADADR